MRRKPHSPRAENFTRKYLGFVFFVFLFF
jgi:hypothetical protein